MISKIFSHISKRIAIESKVKEQVLIDRYTHSCLESEKSLINPDSAHNIMISLTSYSSRVSLVYLTIESLGAQTIKPNSIVLWLDENEFTMETLPGTLKRQIERGLTVKFTPNTGSYKKLFPAIDSAPDMHIITVDDDILYPYDLVERLYKQHQKKPEAIIGCRAHQIQRGKNNEPLPYANWSFEIDEPTAGDAFITSGGGTFFPANEQRKSLKDTDLAIRLCPNADDVWINCVAKSVGIEINKVPLNTHYRKKFLFLSNDSEELKHANVEGGLNDKYLNIMQQQLGSHL
ncbi:glycosyltransferase family 2 protein [Vibrio sp. LaRot3]|uniref:glycosyltransferase family 2 protein n=1 Tax=Vibrio sp. LaRot3 TaxID=2998829 RepID=UPI0022CE21BF|nr:glycosyltransferase family 2 protein [Vibrio sp. LaRot3]MDA0147825.1 glycosyltransferase family 2 protein [Vibrio sp. LaRot3]